MDRPQRRNKTLYQDSLSQPTSSRRGQNNFLSQPSTSNAYNLSQHSQDDSYEEEVQSRTTKKSSHSDNVSQEEDQLVNSLIRYLFAMDRSKQVITKARIIKQVFDNHGKLFNPVMNKTKNILSKVFGYKIVEPEGNKYILVNEIKNDMPHINYSKTEGIRQVLLFIVLTHIFMQGESCSEDSLWDFLGHLGITSSDNHPYFGNVKHIVEEDFVAQRYLGKVIIEKGDPPKVEFKWGTRAEYEFSRRSALEFVSKVYNGRAINSWPLQFKVMTANEKSNKS